jgi:hypothetical protein
MGESFSASIRELPACALKTLHLRTAFPDAPSVLTGAFNPWELGRTALMFLGDLGLINRTLAPLPFTPRRGVNRQLTAPKFMVMTAPFILLCMSFLLFLLRL